MKWDLLEEKRKGETSQSPHSPGVLVIRSVVPTAAPCAPQRPAARARGQTSCVRRLCSRRFLSLPGRTRVWNSKLFCGTDADECAEPPTEERKVAPETPLLRCPHTRSERQLGGETVP